jgi:hypothetical protein
MNSNQSPYLSNGHRLADVLAAIQVMGAYTWASRKVSDWSEKLGVPISAKSWEMIFKEHPEFFRVKDEWISLRWRHGYDRNYSVQLARDLSNVEIAGLSEQEKDDLTRKPLTADQIEALMKTAIELHTRAIAQMQEIRWFIPLLFALLGIILGAVMQAALR